MLSDKNSRAVRVNLEIEVTDEDLGDVMCTALEGGIGYWACLDNTRDEWKKYETEEYKDTCIDEIATLILLEGKTLYFLDAEGDDEIYQLTLEKLLDGISQVVAIDSTLLVEGKLDLCSVDAEIADNIIQYGIFNELVFG